MHQMFGGFGRGHGHSHAPGTECSGHGHGDGSFKMPEMTEEMRQAMLRQLEARMEMMKAAQGNVLHHGHVLHDPNSPNPGSYNSLMFGIGHEPSPPPHGWGSFTPSSPPMMYPSVPVSMEEMMQHCGTIERDRFWLFSVPWLGRLRMVKDRSGLLQASGVVLYWLAGNWITWNTILLPYYSDGVLPLYLLLFYATISILCITSFFRASTMNPGSLHADLREQDDWTDCKICNIRRPPMSHHCRRCGHCVRRMDHHCPWINNCVGEENQFAFMLLLLYAFLLSLCTAVLVLLYYFKLDACVTCDKESFVVANQNQLIYIDIALSMGMIMSSSVLFFSQHINVISEIPAIEWMKLQREIFVTGSLPKQLKADIRPMSQVYSEVCGAPCYLWLFPCRRRRQPKPGAGSSNI